MTKKQTWSESAKSGLIQFPDKPQPKEVNNKSWPPKADQWINQTNIINLAKEELNGPKIAAKLGLSYTYVISYLKKAGSFVWLEQSELVDLRNARGKKTNQS